MNRKSIIYILLIFSFLFESCDSTPQTHSEQNDNQTIAQENANINSPPEVREFLESAEIIYFDEMSSINDEYWFSTQTTLENGLLQLANTEEENPFFGSQYNFEQGDSTLILIKFNEAAQFELAMEGGIWDTKSFQRWGLYLSENSIGGNVWYGKELLEPQELFSGPLSLKPDQWFYILFIVGEDRGIQYIWEKDNPSNMGEYSLAFRTDWEGQTWGFITQVFEGELEIDEFYVLTGKIGEQITGIETIPTITPEDTDEPIAPQPTADTIFYNGKILTMTAGLPTEQAIALKGELILAVGNDEQILALAGEETHIIDLAGSTIMPGFVDAHTHILNDAEYHLGLTLDEAQDLALENGITTLANMYVEEWFLNELQSLERAGDLRVRTSAYLVGTNNCGESQGDWYTAYSPTDEFGEMLRIGGVKLFTDGGTCGYAAVTQETHPGAGQGDLFMSDNDLEDLVRMADDAGYQVAIHALGDRAIDQAIDALNAVIDAPGNPERHRLEHAFYMIDGQFGRFSEMGVHPVIFGYWPTCSAGGEDRTENWKRTIHRWRELVDANPDLIIAAKTDTPWMGPPSPLLELYSLTTLQEVAPDGTICEPAAWIADQTLTIEEALPMVTINAAYLLFREDEVGSLEPGKLADLIILSDSPLDVNLEDIKDIEIWMTMVSGETVYCMDGQDQFCLP